MHSDQRSAAVDDLDTFKNKVIGASLLLSPVRESNDVRYDGRSPVRGRMERNGERVNGDHANGERTNGERTNGGRTNGEQTDGFTDQATRNAGNPRMQPAADI